MSRLAFTAIDGERLLFDVPKHVNRWLVLRAVEKRHNGGDAALAEVGLTRRETEVVAEIVAKLEEHRA